MFASLLKGARFLDAELEDWHLETWAWLMRHRGGMARIERTALATPSRDFFPPSEAVGEDRAIHVFDCVRRLMGMEDYPCRLETRGRAPSGHRVAEVGVVNTRGGVNGTFQLLDGVGVITYAEALIDDPMRLVATLAHELSHYLLRGVTEDVPGGYDAMELATDLTVAYRGLGLFSANTAFSFQQHQDTYSQGWSSQRSGYFSPRSWTFANAVFLALKGAAADAGDPWLKGEVAEMTRAAGRYLAKRPGLLEPLRAIA